MYFDQAKADLACNFFELILRHTSDDWYGQPFILAPWQEQSVRHLFGWRRDDGSWLTEAAYLEVPKKTGKTELMAGMVLMVLTLEAKPGCQVYGAASSQKQAMQMYRAACKMVEQSPPLQQRLRVMRGTSRIVKRSDPDSFYAAIAADGDSTDGVNPYFSVADEVHRWRTRKQQENWDVLARGGIARRQGMVVAITTAGVQTESPLAWRLHEKAMRIQRGVVEDPTFFGRVYGAEQGDDWTDEATWIKANPSLRENGGFLDIARLRTAFQSMADDPEDQRAFRRYYLNMWDQKEDRAIDMERWDACAGPWTATGLRPLPPEDVVRPVDSDTLRHLIDRPCWAGVDLSFTTDLTAVALVFPPAEGNGVWDVLPFFWLPEACARTRELQDGVPYRTWAEQGFLELAEGEAIDTLAVRRRLEWAARMFDLREICFDRYNARETIVQLATAGHTCIEVPQMFNLSAPTKKLIELAQTGRLSHGGHPVMRWMASCVAVKSDGNDNIRPVKPARDKERTRIDGISAAITAMSRALLDQPFEMPSLTLI